jgi:hypothetical protein
VGCRWEASRHLKARLARAGYSHEGRPGTWGEVYRVWRECKVSSHPSIKPLDPSNIRPYSSSKTTAASCSTKMPAERLLVKPCLRMKG